MLKLGTYNIRFMNTDEGIFKQVEELARINWHIGGLSETK